MLPPSLFLGRKAHFQHLNAPTVPDFGTEGALSIPKRSQRPCFWDDSHTSHTQTLPTSLFTGQAGYVRNYVCQVKQKAQLVNNSYRLATTCCKLITTCTNLFQNSNTYFTGLPSNHNSAQLNILPKKVVIYLDSTSNHNSPRCSAQATSVVIYLDSTSNHNSWVREGKIPISCLLSGFYIKPQQLTARRDSGSCCLLSGFYIKPQPSSAD